MTRALLCRWWLFLLPTLALFAAGCDIFIAPPLAVDPVGARVYLVDATSNSTIRIVDARTHETIGRIPLDVALESVAVNPSNGELYAASGGSIFIVDTSSNQVAATISLEAEIAALALNTAGTRIFTSHRHPDGISVIDGGPVAS